MEYFGVMMYIIYIFFFVMCGCWHWQTPRFRIIILWWFVLSFSIFQATTLVRRLIEFYLKKESEGPWTSLSKKKLPWVKVPMDSKEVESTTPRKFFTWTPSGIPALKKNRVLRVRLFLSYSNYGMIPRWANLPFFPPKEWFLNLVSYITVSCFGDLPCQMMSIRLVILCACTSNLCANQKRPNIKNLRKNRENIEMLPKVDWKRWQDSDDEEEGKSNAWNLDGAGPISCIFAWHFVGILETKITKPQMPGLGDMNFGDMGGDEYDSDDEDEIEWDS